jgi:adenosylcobinamide-GDP ribazoletransferase
MTIPDGWLADCANDLKASIAFLTRLPVAGATPAAGADIARAAWAFPLAGILVALIAAVVYAVAHKIGSPPWVAAALAVAATLAVTGALHEDGLADTVDGFGGGDTRER